MTLNLWVCYIFSLINKSLELGRTTVAQHRITAHLDPREWNDDTAISGVVARLNGNPIESSTHRLPPSITRESHGEGKEASR